MSAMQNCIFIAYEGDLDILFKQLAPSSFKPKG